MPHPHGPADAAAPTVGPSVQALNPAESVWVAQQRSLVAELCDGTPDPRAAGDLFDRVQATWLASADRADPEPLVNAFGVALGDLVMERVPGLDWADYRDEQGTEMVLRHAGTDLLVFPVGAVRQHWGSAARGWFASYVQEVAQGARDMAARGTPQA